MGYLYLTVHPNRVPIFGRMSQYTDVYWAEWMLFFRQAVAEKLEFIDGSVTYRVDEAVAGVLQHDAQGYYITLPANRIMRFSTTEETLGVKPVTSRVEWVPLGIPPAPRRQS